MISCDFEQGAREEINDLPLFSIYLLSSFTRAWALIVICLFSHIFLGAKYDKRDPLTRSQRNCSPPRIKFVENQYPSGYSCVLLQI